MRLAVKILQDKVKSLFRKHKKLMLNDIKNFNQEERKEIMSDIKEIQEDLKLLEEFNM